jgi:uncharacterized protein (UPF0548 family)
MTGRLLVGEDLERLRDAGLTYREVGHTRGMLPSGYHRLRRGAAVGTGADRFEQATRRLLGWDVHRGAGLSVSSSSERVVEGAVAVVRVGPGIAAVTAPVRVVYVVSEPHRVGFAYGTLPGHPESGEEAFVVELAPGGTVTFTITAFSRPSSLVARAAGPIGRVVQSAIADRYLGAI